MTPHPLRRACRARFCRRAVRRRLLTAAALLAVCHSAVAAVADEPFPEPIAPESLATPVSLDQGEVPGMQKAQSDLPPMPDRFGAALSNEERPGVVLTVTAGGGPANNESPLAGPNPGGYEAMAVCPPPIRITDDVWCFLPRLGSDSWGVVNNINNLAILGVGLAGSIAIRDNWDGPVRNWTAEYPDRWGEGSKVIGNFGVAQYQIPVILAAYGYTVWAQDAQDHEMMMSLISAYALTGLSTLVIKGIADTKRPTTQWNGGQYGFPSYHTASLFAISAVLDDYEGHWVGVPMYIFSGLVGWSRIDTRDHDLSDVVFGAILGYVIGQSVAGKALYGDSRVHIIPYVQPTDGGSAGLMFDMSF